MKTIHELNPSKLTVNEIEGAYMIISGVGDLERTSHRIPFSDVRNFITDALRGRVEALEAFVSSMAGNLNLTLEPESAIMWWGEADDVPEGWGILDGRTVVSRGRTITLPDYRNRLPVGVGPRLAQNEKAGTMDNQVVRTSQSQPHVHMVMGTTYTGVIDGSQSTIPLVAYTDRWRYLTTTSPDANYAARSLNDSGWAIGNGGFGSAYVGNSISGNPARSVGTPLPTGSNGQTIWLRRTFTINTPSDLGSLNIRLWFDDFVTVYWNGEIMPMTQYNAYMARATVAESKVLSGDNVIAIKVVNGNTPHIFVGAEIIAPSHKFGSSDNGPHQHGMEPAAGHDHLVTVSPIQPTIGLHYIARL